MRCVRGLWTMVAVAALAGCQEAPKGGEGDKGTSGATSPKTGKPGRTDEPARSFLSFLMPDPLKVPEGTTLALSLEATVSSETSHDGEVVLAKLVQDVTSGERVLLPAGAEVRGKVLAAVPSGRVSGRARLAVAFDRLVVKGREYPIEASGLDVTAEPQHGRDAAIIGGGAGAGAIIGGIAKGGKGAAIGALIGAGAGTGTVLVTKGKDVVFEVGARCNVRLTRGLTLG
jgi:hypothetical protein